MKFGKRRRDKPGPGELTKDMADALMQEMSDAGINVSFGETPIRSVDDLAHASGLTADQLLNPPQSPGPELKPGDTVRLRGQRIRGSLDQLLPDGRWVVAWADLTTSWTPPEDLEKFVNGRWVPATRLRRETATDDTRHATSCEGCGASRFAIRDGIVWCQECGTPQRPPIPPDILRLASSPVKPGEIAYLRATYAQAWEAADRIAQRMIVESGSAAAMSDEEFGTLVDRLRVEIADQVSRLFGRVTSGTVEIDPEVVRAAAVASALAARRVRGQEQGRGP